MPEKNTLIVSDTGPLITLCVLGKLHVLNKLYGNVLIPEAVYHELNKEEFPKEVAMVDACSFIHVRKVKNTNEVMRLLNSDLKLHLGESEAIVLTEEADSNAKFLIIDDKNARNYAEVRGITTIGAIGVLSAAIRQGLIPFNEVEICIQIMKKSHRFYTETLYDGLRKIAISNTPHMTHDILMNHEDLVRDLAQSYQREVHKRKETSEERGFTR